MKNRGLTLIEFIVAMVMGGIILLALTCQFVAEHTFRAMINNQIAATNDASIAMRHMTRVIRYARQSTVSTTPAAGYNANITATIDRAAADISLPEFTGAGYTADPVVIYGRKSDDTFEYTINNGTPYVISNHIRTFSVTWDSAYKDLTIQLTAQYPAQQGGRSSSLNTNIRVLGR